MEYLAFAKERFFEIEPVIKASIFGDWRLKDSQMIGVDLVGSERYKRRPLRMSDLCLELRETEAAEYVNCTVCLLRNRGECRMCNVREFKPLEYNPQTGILRMDKLYYRVVYVDQTDLLLVASYSLDCGKLYYHLYRRIG